MAQQTGLSKSSGHRLTQAMERRAVHPESWWWETEDGRQWLTRLVAATLYLFGLKRGVGTDTMSEFCARLHLETHVGCSPSALRGVRQTLAQTSVETAQAWEKQATTTGEVREIIGAVDETCFAPMRLVCMDSNNSPPPLMVTMTPFGSMAPWSKGMCILQRYIEFLH